MTDYAVLGKPFVRVDGLPKVTGAAKYTADFRMPNMLHGKILRSPYPHARILNVDTSRAERLPGVKAVITAKDGPGKKYGQMPQYADEHIPALHKVRYVGEAVAAVAAADEDAAEAAVRLIAVEYEILPAVLDMEDALKPDAPQLHDHVAGNASIELNWHFGNVDEAFAAADLVREDSFETQPVTHSPHEPHTVLAYWESNSRLTLWASTQSATVLRHNIAYALSLPESQVRVIQPHVGGGYGGKMELYAHDVCSALLSKKSGRPVLIAANREEVTALMRERHPARYTLKTGVKKDGTLLARHMRAVMDGGAYMSIGALSMYLFGAFLNLPYRLPNYRYEGRRAYTNKTPAGAYRGHGQPQSNFGAEQQIEMIAHDLGIDPAEMRLRNAIHAGEETANKFKIRSCGFTECVDKAVALSGWKEKRGKGQGRRGIGMACDSYGSGVNYSPHLLPTVFIKIHYDGTIALLTGASEIGQGILTVCTMIAAEELGVHPEDIQVTAGDTEITPLDSGSYSSRVTVAVGNAARLAAIEARKELFDVVAEKLEVNPDDLEARGHRIYVKGSPDKGMTYPQVMKACFEADKLPILVKGSWKSPINTPDYHYGYGDTSHAYTFCAQVAEVEVDPDTGQVTIDQMTAVHDCGFTINPLGAEGQVEGSIMGALGQAMYENLERERGSTLQSSYLDYKIPISVDSPPVRIEMVHTFDPIGPYGAKEAGESLQVGTAPAIANAIFDAVGVRMHSLPITPEKVLEALEEKKRRDKKT